MAGSCSECKWWNADTARCSKLNCSARVYCNWFESDGQKGASMGTCKECRWWEDNHSYGFGTCHKMMCTVTGLDSGRIREKCPTDARGEIPTATFENFGCVHFEAKRQGPFFVDTTYSDDERWVIYFQDLTNKPLPRSYYDKDDAEAICSWLNSLWPK